MFLSRLLDAKARPRSRSQRILLEFDVLEERAVLSPIWGPFQPGPATQLLVVAPAATQSGSAFHVEVEALDASGHLAFGYTGTVALTLGTTDLGATLPAAYAFTNHDFGAHTFLVTLAATGPQTIKAAGVLNSVTISGSAQTDVTPAPVLTQLLVKTPEEATVNVPTYVTIEALDQSGHVMTNFTGQIALTSSASATGSPNHHTAAASLPIDYTFTTADHGEHTFQVTFTATGTAVTVTASSTSHSVTGTGQVNVYTASTVTHFGVFTSFVATPGSPVRVFVEALNASDQVVTGYTGTITLTSSDSAAKGAASLNTTPTALPLTYKFLPGDDGTHTFWITFANPGNQTITATDPTATPGTGVANVWVSGRKWNWYS